MELKLLAIFDEVYKTRHVSRAGENLGIPQSSVSIALAKLRDHFDDPLFVRTSDGMHSRRRTPRRSSRKFDRRSSCCAR
jgi:DNA-binding transcriptional LysR family regulator